MPLKDASLVEQSVLPPQTGACVHVTGAAGLTMKLAIDGPITLQQLHRLDGDAAKATLDLGQSPLPAGIYTFSITPVHGDDPKARPRGRSILIRFRVFNSLIF